MKSSLAEYFLVCLLVFVTYGFGQKDPHVLQGRSAIVHLFEWKFSDIAQECETFLGPHGYAGVQVSPVHENLVVSSPSRPWWERYQVISYNIISRSGNETEFTDMVQRCNNVGVRIYVDVVLNHMSGNHPNAHGVGGNTANPAAFLYNAVPYGRQHFHRPCGINNYSDVNNVRNCELVGLHDLKQDSAYVREKQINFLNVLVDNGVAGFRVDAAKHMWPSDLEYIYSQVKNLSIQHGFAPNSRPFFFQEVIDLGSEGVHANEYTNFGRVTEFKYGAQLSNAFREIMPSNGYITSTVDGDSLLMKMLLYLLITMIIREAMVEEEPFSHTKNPNCIRWQWPLCYHTPYGYPRIMSSFQFVNTDQGPPQDRNGNIISRTVRADGNCGNSWVCEHRWRQIYSMVDFRNVVEGTSVSNWWDNSDKQIAFCRGDKGFIAFNDQYDTHFMQTLQTCLPAGTYCDIISGSKSDSLCSGKAVTVNNNGTAYIEILSSDFDGVLAIHLNSKL